MTVLKIQLNPKLLQLTNSIEKDVSKAINEALTLWLKKKIITCPITNQFCIHINGQCNDCNITQKRKT